VLLGEVSPPAETPSMRRHPSPNWLKPRPLPEDSPAPSPQNKLPQGLPQKQQQARPPRGAGGGS